MLIMTPMKAPDGRVCALAQGSVSIGGFNIRSGSGNSFRKNHSTVGMIPGGGQITSRLEPKFLRQDGITWLLHHPDFGTAHSVAANINKVFGDSVAHASDGQRSPSPHAAAASSCTSLFDAVVVAAGSLTQRPEKPVATAPKTERRHSLVAKSFSTV